MVRLPVLDFDKKCLTWLSLKIPNPPGILLNARRSNQCPVPEICMTGSPHRNGSSHLDDVTAGCTSCDKSVPVNSSSSRTGNCSVSSSTGGDSVFVDPLLICIGICSINSPPVALI